MDSDPTYDLFEDVIVKIKWGQLTRLEQHTQLRRVLAIGHKQCIDWLNKEHQRRKHGDNFAVVMARQMREDLKIVENVDGNAKHVATN